jgi:hypothetical protein
MATTLLNTPETQGVCEYYTQLEIYRKLTVDHLRICRLNGCIYRNCTRCYIKGAAESIKANYYPVELTQNDVTSLVFEEPEIFERSLIPQDCPEGFQLEKPGQT